MIVAANGRVGRAGRCPSVRARVICPAGVQSARRIVDSAPNDHFAARPHCRVIGPHDRCVSRTRGCPGVRERIVTPAGVKPVPADIKKIAAPNNHFDTGPDCRVLVAA